MKYYVVSNEREFKNVQDLNATYILVGDYINQYAKEHDKVIGDSYMPTIKAAATQESKVIDAVIIYNRNDRVLTKCQFVEYNGVRLIPFVLKKKVTFELMNDDTDYRDFNYVDFKEKKPKGMCVVTDRKVMQWIGYLIHKKEAMLAFKKKNADAWNERILELDDIASKYGLHIGERNKYGYYQLMQQSIRKVVTLVINGIMYEFTQYSNGAIYSSLGLSQKYSRYNVNEEENLGIFKKLSDNHLND